MYMLCIFSLCGTRALNTLSAFFFLVPAFSSLPALLLRTRRVLLRFRRDLQYIIRYYNISDDRIAAWIAI
jgi:hypothetical protein